MGRSYPHLSLEERRKIERLRHAKLLANEMAPALNRCRSTNFRGLKRNHFSDPSPPKCGGYYGAAVPLMTADRCARQQKLIRYPELRKTGH
ncbi:helix-turn-helix domain-containing protein (plasmid) [Roseobacteraceae bacterium NS-SX3]